MPMAFVLGGRSVTTHVLVSYNAASSSLPKSNEDEGWPLGRWCDHDECEW